jgi:hypothetical protein
MKSLIKGYRKEKRLETAALEDQNYSLKFILLRYLTLLSVRHVEMKSMCLAITFIKRNFVFPGKFNINAKVPGPQP